MKGHVFREALLGFCQGFLREKAAQFDMHLYEKKMDFVL